MRGCQLGSRAGMFVIIAVFMLSAMLSAAEPSHAAVRHVDHFIRKGVEKQIRQAGSATEELRIELDQTVIPQRYANRGPGAAAARRAAKAAAAAGSSLESSSANATDRHRLQTRPGGRPFYGAMENQQIAPAGWGGLRVVWETSQLFPTDDNPTPDGNKACYAVGPWVQIKDPEGDAPTEGPDGCPGDMPIGHTDLAREIDRS